MADITQRLGFDVSQGISALNSLTGSVNNLTQALQTLNKTTVGGVSRSIGNLTKKLGAVPDAARNAASGITEIAKVGGLQQPADKVNKVTTELNKVPAAANNAGNSIRQGFAGSFVFTKALSGLRSIIGVLKEAAFASQEFQFQIAEIETIAGGASFDELASSIRAISLEFGGPDAEVAASAYQAFSNQVVQSTSDLEKFLPIVNKLSIATGSEAQDAVNALSSVLNTYGEAAGDASQISDVLFKTVELGRTRFAEFANSLGTINSLAKEAGVSFTEVQAGIADITRTGTTTSVALTQLRGVFTKLVKPTDKLRQAFREFGAKDGPSFVKASGGLFQALQRLQEFSERSGISIVELFGRVRGGQGALNILRDEGESFIDTFNQLEEAASSGGEVIEEAFSKVAETDAFGAKLAFNELQSRMTELGDAVLPIITKFVELFNTVTPNTRTLGIVIGGVAASLGVLALAGASAVIPLAAIAAFLVPFAPALLGIAAATALVVTALNEQNAALDLAKQKRTEEARLAKDAAEAQVEAAKTQVDAITSAIGLADDLLEQFYGDQLEDARELNRAAKDELQGFVDSFVESRRDAIKEIESTIKGLDDVISDSTGRIRDAQRQLSDITFEKSIKGLNSNAVATKTLERASQAAAKAREDFANAGLDKEARREALDQRRLAFERIREAERAAAATKTEVDDKRVADAKEKFLNDIVTDEANFSTKAQKLRDEEQDKARQVTDALKEQVTEVQSLTGKYAELVSSVDEFDNVKGPQQIKDDLVEAERVARELIAILGQEVDPFGVTDEIGAREGLDRGTEQILQGLVRFDQNQAVIRANLQEVLDSDIFTAKVQFGERLEGAEVQLNTAQAEDQIAGLKLKLDQSIADLNRQILITPEIDPSGATAAIVEFSGGLVEAQTGAVAAFSQSLRNITADAATFDRGQVDAAKQQLDRARIILEDSVQKGRITAEEQVAIQNNLKASTGILEQRQAIIDAEAAAAKSETSDVTQEVTNAKNQTQQLATETGKVATAAGTTQQATAPLAGQIQAAVGPANQLASALERAANARAQATSGGTATAFFGKTIHRQAGGFTRGQDRILTSTAPGEVVINADAARGITSQLTAINAQQTPQFRETGGTVTTVGDINVNIQSQDPGRISGRQIASELDREIRTRGSRLFNS